MTHPFGAIRPDEAIVVGFAGGGGSSDGVRRALGRAPDFAYNHNPVALWMHQVNHPETHHVCADLWGVDPEIAAGRRPLALGWFSPDCRDHSKAKGSAPDRAPIRRESRDLGWVVVRWARVARPRVIMVENVEEFTGWGPLKRRPDGAWVRDPARKGETFRAWVQAHERLGYKVEWRFVRGCDYGDPTIRKRLLVIMRRDGLPIRWPAPTHGPAGSGLLPWRTAADIIDWSIPCPSIFLTKEEGRAIGVKRPLVDATMARIARGVKRYVIDAAEPFIVPVTHRGDLRVHPIHEPLRTVTTAHRGEHALVVPTLIQTGYGERQGQAPRVPGLEKPLGTVVAGGGKHALVAAFLAQHNSGMVGHPVTDPVSTITQRGTQQAVIQASFLSHHYTSNTGGGAGDVRDPVKTVTAGGLHAAECRAFLMKYYGAPQDPRLDEPLHTVTTKDRFGLVMVHGEPYRIVDIGMRMLTARELFRAQGFDDSYIIAEGPDGQRLTHTQQVQMAGNSVNPGMAAAHIAANFPPEDLGSLAA